MKKILSLLLVLTVALSMVTLAGIDRAAAFTDGVPVWDATELLWNLGNQFGEGKYVRDGFRVSMTDAEQPAWPVVTLPYDVNVSTYRYMVLVARSDAGASAAIYSRPGGTEVTPTAYGTLTLSAGESAATRFTVNVSGGEASIKTPTFPITNYGGDITFTKIGFFKTATEANNYIFSHTVNTYTDVDALYLDGQTIHSYPGVDDGFTAEFEDKSGSMLTLAGWVALNHKVDVLGYQVDDRAPVFSASFKSAYTEQAVINAGRSIAGSTGESTRYELQIPVEQGTHTVKFVVKLQNAAEEYYTLGWLFTYTDVETGIQSASVSVGGDFTLIVRSLIPDGAEPRMRFTRDEVSTVVEGVYDAGSGTYIFSFPGINTQCMTDPITLELLDGDDVVQTKVYSIRSYADALKNLDAARLGLTDKQKARLDTLLADMLRFGAEAQIYKNYRTDDLADDLPWVDECKTVTDEVPESVKAVLVSGTADDKITGATLYIDNTIRIKVFAKASQADRIVFTHGTVNDTVMLSEAEFSGGVYEVLSKPLKALSIDEIFIISLMDGSNVLSQVSYSANSYAAAKWNADGLKDLVRAMFYYGRSARLYVEGSSGAVDETGEAIILADSLKNGVQGYYDDVNRNNFIVETNAGKFNVGLSNTMYKGLNTIYDDEGRVLLESGAGGMSAYVEGTDGKIYKSNISSSKGRINTTKIGYYYYDVKLRGMSGSTNTSTISSSDYSAPSGSSDNAAFRFYQENALDSAISSGTQVTSSSPVTNMVTSDPSAGQLSASAAYSGTIDDPTDPYVCFELNSAVSTGSKETVTFEILYNGSATSGSLYYRVGTSSASYSESQRVTFGIIPDGSYHRVVLSIEGFTSKTLRGIRIDINDGAAGDTFSIRNMKVIQLKGSKNTSFALEHTLHTYSDKVNSDARLLFSSTASGYSKFGYEYKIPAATVEALEFEDAGGVKTDVAAFTGNKLYYAAFSIRGAGTLGFIGSSDGSSFGSLSVENSCYVVKYYIDISGSHSNGSSVNFGHRIFTSADKDLAGVARASYEERNPLQVVVEQTNTYSDLAFTGYDPASGAYVFTVNSTDFNTAYYYRPNAYLGGSITFKSDGTKRNVYVRVESTSGQLEGGVLLDENNVVLPIAPEICKNFDGEKEEPFYDPNDTAYGNTYYPMAVPAEGDITHTMLNLYQNWGIFAQKQLSSIQFHIGYYHLSTGVTESNCIAPYFVYNRDGWTLPDFRSASGNMWSGQPQFDSVGRLRFMTKINPTTTSETTKNEYTCALIRASGPSYADMDYSYTYGDSNGNTKMTYTLRHVEFPQNDENRTYYTLDATVTEDFTVSRDNFALFSFDGRFQLLKSISYKNASGTVSTITKSNSASSFSSYTLAKDSPFVTLYNYTQPTNSGEGMANFGFIVKNYSLVIGGQAASDSLCFRERVLRTGSIGSYRYLNLVEIGIDRSSISFTAGDTIHMEFVLLPYGVPNQTNYSNVTYVIEDTVNDPWRVTNVEKGIVVEDEWLAIVKADNNEAVFTVSGSRNANAVRVDGFTKLVRPVIEEYVGGQWVTYDTTVFEYDGYQTHYDGETDTFGYSFVVMMDSPTDQRTFRVAAR